MNSRKAPRFLTDNNVPDSTGNALTSFGHDVVRQRDVMATDATDPVVAMAAIQSDRILLSWDKDFNHQRFQSDRFSKLSRVGMACPEPLGANRIHEIEDLIEFAFARAKGNPLTIVVGERKVLVRA